MSPAWTYDNDFNEQHIAVRTRESLVDVFGLKKNFTWLSPTLNRCTTMRSPASSMCAQPLSASSRGVPAGVCECRRSG